jgi:hypothetical protein
LGKVGECADGDDGDAVVGLGGEQPPVQRDGVDRPTAVRPVLGQQPTVRLGHPRCLGRDTDGQVGTAVPGVHGVDRGGVPPDADIGHDAEQAYLSGIGGGERGHVIPPLPESVSMTTRGAE